MDYFVFLELRFTLTVNKRLDATERFEKLKLLNLLMMIWFYSKANIHHRLKNNYFVL